MHPNQLTRRFAAFWLLASLVLLSPAVPVHAQLNFDLGAKKPFFSPQDTAPTIRAEAVFTTAGEQRPAMLYVTAKIQKGWHIYSLTQAAPPLKTEIKLTGDPPVKLLGDFQPSVPPRVDVDDETWEKEVRLEEHSGKVTFYAPIEIQASVDPASLKIEGQIDWQACGDHGEGCVLGQTKFTAAQGEAPFVPAAAVAEQEKANKPDAVGEYRAARSNITIAGRVEPSAARPGSRVEVLLTAKPDQGWHIYPLAETEDANPEVVTKPTLVVVDAAEGVTAYRAYTTAEPVTKTSALGEQTYHEGSVTWRVPIDVPQDAEPGEYPIRGVIGYQICTDNTCQQPLAVRFEGTLTIASSPGSGSEELRFYTPEGGYSEAAKRAAAWSPPELKELPPSVAEAQAQSVSASMRGAVPLSELLTTLGVAFLGGLILNLMPCVLPVIGLKILSFVEQAGQSRVRIFTLNYIYAAGVLSFFLVLAVLTAFLNMLWGELFTQFWFRLSMVGLVFAMALSLLGVWEIPIPGFATSGKVSELTGQEGLSGAFFKGIFTTLLATPCTAPFLGFALNELLGKPPAVVFSVFVSAGVGMASPYLLIGVYPSLVRWLPKPGAWMEIFKEVMGFVMLGAVVFLFHAVGKDYHIATLSFMMAIWFACWLIGRTPFTVSTSARAGAWVAAVAFAAIVGYFSFEHLGPSEYELAWRKYSPAALEEAQQEGKTVLLDFTADWCATCKWNSKVALNTRRVHELVEENDVVPMLADWTDRSDDIKDALQNKYKVNGIPLLIVFPGSTPDEPIKLPNIITEQQVVEALKEAGPSVDRSPQTAAAAGVMRQ